MGQQFFNLNMAIEMKNFIHLIINFCYYHKNFRHFEFHQIFITI